MAHLDARVLPFAKRASSVNIAVRLFAQLRAVRLLS